MEGENNFKDTHISIRPVVKDTSLLVSYSKTNKLITALYMVTDMMPEGEPVRLKLRGLGADLLTDLYSLQLTNGGMTDKSILKISQILSFLEISTTVGMISEMNSNILQKEFAALKNLIEESSSKQTDNFSRLFREEPKDSLFSYPKAEENSQVKYLGREGLRIGVQKASTFMKALSDKTSNMSDRKSVRNIKDNDNFAQLKQQRRQEIISIIKKKRGGNYNGH